MNAVPTGGGDGAADELTILDLVLGEGSADERAALRARIERDPLALLEMAEHVAFVQDWQQLRVEASPAFPLVMAGVARRAERRLQLRTAPRGTWRGPLTGVLAAAALLAVLLWWDPLAVRGDAERAPTVAAEPRRTTPAPVVESGSETGTAGADALAGAPVVAFAEPLDVREFVWQSDLERMRARLGLESSPHLQQALEAGLGQPGDSLGRWLDPRNSLMMMRLDHELRASAPLRREALRRQGGMAAADERVQHLADLVAVQLADVAAERSPAAMADMAMAVRALIAAGPDGAERSAALRSGSDWLAAQLPGARPVELVQGLAALLEVVAVTSRHHELVREQGERLLAHVLRVDGENWSRRLPELLGSRVPAGVLADASRVLRRLPGIGVDAGRCALVRQLLLGPLRERRAGGEDSPQLIAAMLYGSGDLLGRAERDQLEMQIRRWKPMHLAPDFATLQQIAWALEPGHHGFVRHQGELRQLAVCGDPLDLGARGALCLCLATGYAAFAGGVLPQLAGS